jgi:hypothetical protein
VTGHGPKVGYRLAGGGGRWWRGRGLRTRGGASATGQRVASVARTESAPGRWPAPGRSRQWRVGSTESRRASTRADSMVSR